ncbi:MAG: hypothetical protein AAF253_12285 [Pseudomonadota bacterium]
MPDGHAYGEDDFDVIDPAALDEAIRSLEAGEPIPDGGIDLGGGCFARPDGPNGAPGLLQRLTGHRMLLQLARNRTVLTGGGATVTVNEDVKSLLDAVRKAG